MFSVCEALIWNKLFHEISRDEFNYQKCGIVDSFALWCAEFRSETQNSGEGISSGFKLDNRIDEDE